MNAKTSLKKPEASLYHVAQKANFHALNNLGVDHKCDRQTDGPTDRYSDSKCCT